MATTVYKKTALTGGAASALDSIDGNSLLDGDIAFVFTGTLGYFYHLNATSGAAESSPDVISPDTNAGTKRWILQDVQSGSGNPVLTNLLPNTQWIANSGSTAENVGSDLVTNGGFASDTTGWTAQSCTIASVAGGQAGNCLEITRTAESYQYGWQNITGLTIGKLYKITCYIKSGTSGAETAYLSQWDGSLSSRLNYASGTTTGSWVQLSLVFEATQTNHYIAVEKQSATAGTMLFDSVTLYEITPGYVAADALAPDGWYKLSGLQVLRQHNDGGTYTKDGSFYALKFTSITAADHMIWPLSAVRTLAEHYQRFAGRTVTFGAWCWASTASHMFLQIVDSDTTDDDQTSDGSAYHTGGSGWEWLEVTMTVSASTTEFSVAVCFDSTTDAYFSQPMLVFGSSIGQGNYAPMPGEVIWLQSLVRVESGTALASGAVAKNTESWTSGKIGKSIKAAHFNFQCQNTAAGKNIQILPSTTATNGVKGWSAVANVQFGGGDWTKADANGDFAVITDDANFSNTYIDIDAIQT